MATVIGRTRESAELDAALVAIRAGRGGLLLLASEAGVGKTHLASDAQRRQGLLAPRSNLQESAPSYAPITAAFRAYLRVVPDGLSDFGPVAANLALLLLELGSPRQAGIGRPCSKRCVAHWRRLGFASLRSSS